MAEATGRTLGDDRSVGSLPELLNVEAQGLGKDASG